MKLEVADMGFPEELKKIRQNSLLSQKSFAEELGVSYLSVSRWEGGHTKPNWKGMKSIKEFCIKNRLDYQAIIGVTKQIRKQINKGFGDTVQVVMEQR